MSSKKIEAAPQPILSSFIRTRPRVYSDTVGETMTQREHASECDINFQIERFKGLGINPHQPLNPQQFADLSELSTDFIHAHQTLEEGRAAFDELPENVQRRFHGSPQLFMEFMSDIHNNLDEAVELGLVKVREGSSPNPQSPPAEPPKAASTPPQGAPEGGSKGSGA